jgi:hypothetical protein
VAAARVAYSSDADALVPARGATIRRDAKAGRRATREGCSGQRGCLFFSQLCLEPCASHPRSPILSCSLADDILAYCQAQVATDLLDMEGVDAGGNDAGPSSPSSGTLVSACVRTRKRRQSALDSACTERVHVGGGGSRLDAATSSTPPCVAHVFYVLSSCIRSTQNRYGHW